MQASGEATEEPWADRYERLRVRGLRPGQRVHDAQGLVLFMREGTVSWMRALAARRPKPAASVASPAEGLLAKGVAADLTQALTTMVLTAAEMLR